MRANSWRRDTARWLAVTLTLAAGGASGCKTFTERYIALEVWKYEKCFGHLPPGFVPQGAVAPAAPPPRVCGQAAACPPAPCGGGHVAGGCDQCQGGIVDGGMPAGSILPPGMPSGPGGVPAGPGGSPGTSAAMPTPAAVSSSRPVVISDEVVLP